MTTSPCATSSQAAPSKLGRTVHLLGSLLTFRATGAETEGALSVVEAVTAPGAGAPPHLQRRDAEAFYVLEGAFDFTIGGTTVRGEAGSFHYVPKDVPHSFRNPGDRPARMLILNFPAGLHENFFAEAGDALPDATRFPAPAAPDLPRIGATAQRYGIELLPA